MLQACTSYYLKNVPFKYQEKHGTIDFRPGFLLVNGKITYSYLKLSIVPTMRLTTFHFKAYTPMGTQVGTDIFTTYITWALGVSAGN